MFADTSCLHLRALLRMHTWNSVVVYSLHSHRSVSGWMFLLVPAHPGSPRQRCGNGCVCVCVTWDPSHWAQLHLIEHSGAPHASWPPRHLRSCGLPAELDKKRAARKQQVINTTGTVWPCDRCSRTCSSRIGLFAHRRTHRWHNPSYSMAHSMCVCAAQSLCMSHSGWDMPNKHQNRKGISSLSKQTMLVLNYKASRISCWVSRGNAT